MRKKLKGILVNPYDRHSIISRMENKKAGDMIQGSQRSANTKSSNTEKEKEPKEPKWTPCEDDG